MGFTTGLVGLPNVGKSTLFSALTAVAVPAENYEFCTIDPNRGRVAVPDERLHRVAALFAPDRITPTTLEFVDIAGLVEGASRGEGLGNRFLAAIREVDAVVHVLRCFPDDGVVHRRGSVDPVRDLELVETELCLRDLESVEGRIDKSWRAAMGGRKEARALMPALEAAREALSRGLGVRTLEAHQRGPLSDLFLLTDKPVLAVANLGDEQDEDDAPVLALRERGEAEGFAVVAVRARLEAELAELPVEERPEFREAMGLEGRSGLERLVDAGYRLLGLVTFFTTVGTEVRAWTVPAGTGAAAAAGRIHSDMESGFIRAEVIAWDALLGYGSEAAARAAGAIRTEGRDYEVREGDVLRILFR